MIEQWIDGWRRCDEVFLREQEVRRRREVEKEATTSPVLGSRRITPRSLSTENTQKNSHKFGEKREQGVDGLTCDADRREREKKEEKVGRGGWRDERWVTDDGGERLSSGCMAFSPPPLYISSPPSRNPFSVPFSPLLPLFYFLFLWLSSALVSVLSRSFMPPII